jgi:hypothetical protein
LRRVRRQWSLVIGTEGLSNYVASPSSRCVLLNFGAQTIQHTEAISPPFHASLPAFRIVREFGHKFAFSSKSNKFFWRVHRPICLCPIDGKLGMGQRFPTESEKFARPLTPTVGGIRRLTLRKFDQCPELVIASIT